MTNQQRADILLAEHRQARLKIAITRSEQLYNFYMGERLQGVDHMVAHERMAEHAKYLDREMENAS